MRWIFEKIEKGEALNELEREQFISWADKQSPDGSAPAVARTDVIRIVEDALKSRQWINNLAEISNQTGLQIAGEFRTGNGKTPGDGFTGGRFGYPGFTYGGTEYFLAGVSNDALQVGLSLTDGKIYAGEGNIILDTGGIIIRNTNDVADPFLLLQDSTSETVGAIFTNANANLEIFASKLAAGERKLVLRAKSNNAAQVATIEVIADSGGTGTDWITLNADQIDLGATAGGRVTVNGAGRDTDFFVEGDNNPNVFVVDAGNDRVEFKDTLGAAVHIINPTGTTYFNENNGDVDFIVEGDTDGSLFWVDAGLDAIGMGGAAESGYKLKVTGDVKMTGSLIGPIEPETSAEGIYGVAAPGGTSAFSGTINGAPSGTSVVYTPVSGTEGALVPSSTTAQAKMRLYNTTRGNNALIANCNTTTNTITLTATAPANWANGDTITIASQTVSGDGFGWVDLEFTSGPMGRRALFVTLVENSATVGNAVRLHPFESYSSSKSIVSIADVASQNAFMFGLIKLNSNVITISWTGTPASIVVREAGYLA